jgi:tetratricopeptide (TPR) repeat protein
MRQWRLVRRSSAALVLVAFLLSHTTVLAHGDFHVRVAALSTRIEEQPTADHYLERSRLYRGHGDLAAALADLERAERLDPTRADLGLHRVPLERVLAETPDHPEANLALARALADLGRSREAATHYGHAIRAAPVPIPAHYLERADALLAAGEPGAALSGLDEGLARLGPVAALANRAIEIELAQGRVDAALVRLDRLASLASRQETWLARRAEILEAAGRCAEARAAYAAVLAEVERLPPRRRATPAMRHLESRAREALAQLARAPE